MAITVGTDTYISLADARAYVAANALAALPTDDTDAEDILKRAAVAVDRNYGNKFLGQKASITQSLAWPREFASAQPHGTGEWLYQNYDSDGNPRDFSGLQPETGYAQVELAVLINGGTDVYAQPDPFLSQLRQKVSSLEEEKQFKAAQGYRTDPLYRITLILRPLLRTSTGAIPITRGA